MEAKPEFNELESENPYFEIMVSGRFSQDQVKVRMDSHVDLPKELSEKIEDDWTKRNVTRIAKGQKPMDSDPKYIFTKKPEAEGKTLMLEVSQSGFKEFMATRDVEIRKQFPQHVADIIGTNVLIKTSDNKLMIVQRGLDAATKPGAMSVIGGYADPGIDSGEDGTWSPFKTVSRELKEEAAVDNDEINNLSISGVVYNKNANNPSVVFTAETKLTSDEIRKRKGEEVIVKFIEDDQKEIEKAVLWWAFSPSPTGAATLALYGRDKFGDEWFSYVNQRITQRHKRLYQHLNQDQEKQLEKRSANRLSKIN